MRGCSRSKSFCNHQHSLVFRHSQYNQIHLRQERKSNLIRFPIPLLKHGGESLEKRKQQCVAEPAEEGEEQDNRFCEEHLKRPCPNLAKLPHWEARFLELVRTVDVCFAILSTSSGFAIEQNRCASFGDDEKVNDLNSAADAELHPEYPWEGSV